jgi:hypothetical protein
MGPGTAGLGEPARQVPGLGARGRPLSPGPVPYSKPVVVLLETHRAPSASAACDSQASFSGQFGGLVGGILLEIDGFPLK